MDAQNPGRMRLLKKLATMVKHWNLSEEEDKEEVSIFLKVFCKFLKEKNPELMEKMNEEKERRRDLETRIAARKSEIERIWDSEEKWNEVCSAIEDRTYEIANRDREDETNTIFFSDICDCWINLFNDATPEQRNIMKELGGFRYGLAIMLINAEVLFGRNMEPLKQLYVIAYGEDFLNFEDLEVMKGRGMEIMRANKDYDLAYMYLGNES